MSVAKPTPRYSWEQAITMLRADPMHAQMIFDAYLTSDLDQNCRRFHASPEFRETVRRIADLSPGKKLLDMPAGNGIATYAFATEGFSVTAVEPDASATVGRGAITQVLTKAGLQASVVEAYGENLPFPDRSFDVVYIRQGLHHAADLAAMTRECFRVLKSSGVLFACREHVVDDYRASLKSFLDAQVDHQLYGGEHAFTLRDYRSALTKAGLVNLTELGQYDTNINLFPDSLEFLRARTLSSRPGRALKLVWSDDAVFSIAHFLLRRRRTPGRLYSFIARKPDVK